MPKTRPNHIYLIYMYKEDLTLNNLQRLICHKTKPNKNLNLTLLFVIRFEKIRKQYYIFIHYMIILDNEVFPCLK